MPIDSETTLPKSKPRWEWIFSIGLHALLLLAALFVVPFDRILDRMSAQKPPVMEQKRVEELAQFIEQTHEPVIAEEVERMAQILDEMKQLRDAELADVRPQETELIQSAPQRAVQAQKAALAALENAATVAANSDDTGVTKSTADAGDHQTEAAKALDLAGKDFDEQMKEQEAASKLGDDAAKAAASAKTASDKAASADREAADAEKKSAELADKAASIKSVADAANAKAESAASSETDAAEKADAAVAATKADGLDKKEKSAADKAANAAKTAADRASKSADNAKAEADKKQKSADATTANANSAADTAADARKSANAAASARDAKRTDAAKAVAEARDAQAKAMEGLEKKIAGGDKPDLSAVATAEDTPVAVSTASIPESVESAANLENAISESFREMRGARQASIRGVSVKEATESVRVAKPERPEIDAEALAGGAKTAESLEAMKNAVTQATSEVKSMRALAETMLADAANARNAAEDGTQVASGDPADTQSMSSTDANASNDSHASSNDNKATSAAAKAASAKAAAIEDATGKAKDLTRVMAGKPGGAHVVGSGGFPSVPADALKMAAGFRRFAADGQAAGWIFVDSWYVIGPWDNTARRNADTQFPPEQIVDLDGRYVGKNDKTLAWQFHQETSPHLSPPNDAPYGIFYAYTELRFEEPRELWVAVGSDDNSNVWINGFPIWIHSGPERSWSPAHGYRKVKFNKGVNKVLFRIENGHGQSAWSLLIHLPPSDTAPALPVGK